MGSAGVSTGSMAASDRVPPLGDLLVDFEGNPLWRVVVLDGPADGEADGLRLPRRASPFDLAEDVELTRRRGNREGLGCLETTRRRGKILGRWDAVHLDLSLSRPEPGPSHRRLPLAQAVRVPVLRGPRKKVQEEESERVSWGLRQRDWPFGTAKRKKRNVCVCVCVCVGRTHLVHDSREDGDLRVHVPHGVVLVLARTPQKLLHRGHDLRHEGHARWRGVPPRRPTQRRSALRSRSRRREGCEPRA